MARRKYTPESKREAVGLGREESLTNAQVGVDWGVDQNTISNWGQRNEACKR